ncbi:MAG: RES domain-containing protein [Rhodococcus sp. (in: high G+C Gram-positive bacteria)]|nr:MAG: RES domain-containing protein [Rhodococcus sp. (in: high G+C Gram-positive bacteria)]
MGISDWALELDERGYGDVSAYFVCTGCLTAEARTVFPAVLPKPDPCTFCESPGPTMSLEDFMAKFMHMVKLLHNDAAQEALPHVDGQYLAKVWDGEEIAEMYSHLALANDECRNAVRDALAQGDKIWSYRGDLDPPDQAMSFAWTQLSNTVKHRQRYIFLSQEDGVRADDLSARQYLDQLDHIIHNNNSTVRISAGTEIYRVRAYNGKRSFDLVASELGSTPDHLANPNRMSPSGISMFYGSERLETAIAETAGPSTTAVAVGRWKTTKELHLVDLTTDLPLSNLFVAAHGTPADLGRHFDASYLRDFSHAIAEPFDPNISHIEYVPTQVVTEYLRFTRGGTYDGIRFPSAKDSQPNYVLFAGPLLCADRGAAHISTMLELVEAHDEALTWSFTHASTSYS